MSLRTCAGSWAARLARKASAAARQLSCGNAGQVLEQGVGERAAQEPAVVGQRDRRQNGRLGRRPALAGAAGAASSASISSGARRDGTSGMVSIGSRGALVFAHAGSGADATDAPARDFAGSGLAVCSLASRHTTAPVRRRDFLQVSVAGPP